MKKYLKKIVYLFIFFIIAVNSSSKAEMLVTNSGEELYGTILKIDNKSITFNIDGKEKVLKKSELLRIDFTKGLRSEAAISVTDINDELLNNVIAAKAAPENYPNAGDIVLYSEKVFTFSKDNQVTTSYRDIIQVLQERGKNAGVISLAYKKGIQSAQVSYARTINEGLVYNYDHSSLRESAMFFNYPDYDKMKVIRLPLPNVVVGSVLDYSYTITQSTVDTFDPIYKEVYFSSSEPVLKQKVIIKFPKGMKEPDISLRFMGEEGVDYTFKKEDTGEDTIYTYEKLNIKATENESYMPSAEMIMPRITISSSPDFKKITKEFSEKLQKFIVIDGDIKDKVRELIVNANSNEDKIFNIYKYIAKEIDLIPVEPSHYSYLPNKSDFIYSKKAGSYLDKTFLFYTFLKAADINCEFALVKERDKGDVEEKNPCIKQFNYPVVVVPLDVTTLYISALEKDLMITDIDSSIQGGLFLTLSKEGLNITKIPLKPAEKENLTEIFVVNLFEDGSITIKATKIISGNNQGSLRMFQYMPEKNLKQYLLEMVHGIHPNAELIDYKFENLDNLKMNPKLEISYSIKDYMISAGGKLLVFQLPSLSYSAYEVGKTERNYPISFAVLTSNNKKYTLNVPDNYKIHYIPDKKYSYKSDNFIYNASYKVEGNEIKFEDSYQRLGVFMPKEVYFELKKCLETRAELAKEWIVIEKE